MKPVCLTSYEFYCIRSDGPRGNPLFKAIMLASSIMAMVRFDENAASSG